MASIQQQFNSNSNLLGFNKYLGIHIENILIKDGTQETNENHLDSSEPRRTIDAELEKGNKIKYLQYSMYD